MRDHELDSASSTADLVAEVEGVVAALRGAAVTLEKLAQLLKDRPAANPLYEVFLTGEELSARWRLKEQTLANQRAAGEGIPYTKLPSGSIRYKLADILEAEREGHKGFTWFALEKTIRRFPGLGPNTRIALCNFLRIENRPRLPRR
ncbi:hypothetical protein [Hyphomicrobium sp. D-2]|uniref:hypothetical protein n=1 Tax=Hyphomicrobium sp. D-2 TaxID=3041621 RepID=UPI0024553361|nr:hypothetical protein [Hyphomicrobium sp. D-2]MDH4981470.1 hypothetical protein [Hyphomicrobium sp. D-2]